MRNTTNTDTSTVSQSNVGSNSSISSSSSAPIKLQPSQAMHWNFDQVQQWLTVLGLDQHIPIFNQNEINGQVLLDLTPGDLDYMNITTLGHRKLILKGIDQLKTAINNNTNKSSHTTTNTSVDTNVATEIKLTSSSSPQKLHWSQTLPSNTSSSSSQSTHQTTTSSSLLDGQYDEEAERRAFQDAVMAWRKANGKTTSIIKSTEDDGMWTNPFGSNDDNTNSSSTDTNDTQSGSRLLDGVYDEEAERRSFQEAVMAWRNGNSSNSTTTVSPSTGKSNKSQSNVKQSSESGSSSTTNTRSTCYNCLRMFHSHLGFHPSSTTESDEEENSSSTLVRSLTTKPFCSSACYDAAAMGILRLEAAKTAARADVDAQKSDANNNNDTQSDNDSIEYEYPNEASNESSHRINGALTAADYGTNALPPSPVLANGSKSILSPQRKNKGDSHHLIDNLAAEAEAAGLSLVHEYEQQTVARKNALMQASLRAKEKENESKYNDQEESKEEKIINKNIDIWKVDMSDFI